MATTTDWRAKQISGLRTQFRTMFRTMAVGGRWHVHRGSAGLVLLAEGARMDVPLPIILHDVQAMTEDRMASRIHDILSA